MSRLITVIALILIGFLAAGAVFAQDLQPKAEWPAYLLSVFIGFGTGHYYLGANGTPFLIGDVLGLGVEVGGLLYELGAAVALDTTQTLDGLTLVIVGAGIFLVSRIWEVVDVFSAADEARKAGRVAAVVPVFSVRRTSFESGVAPALSYEVGVSLTY